MITKHLKYLSYVIRHKWFVFIECCKLGIPLRGLMHDFSKFFPSEWFPYATYFYGKKVVGATGYFHKPGSDERFDFAWLQHQKRNPHHHQYWVLLEDSGATKVFEMPLKYRKEMLADWRGAGKAQGKPDTRAWYEENKGKMRLGPETRAWVEQQLGFQSAEYTEEELLLMELFDPANGPAGTDAPLRYPARGPDPAFLKAVDETMKSILGVLDSGKRVKSVDMLAYYADGTVQTVYQAKSPYTRVYHDVRDGVDVLTVDQGPLIYKLPEESEDK